jgi:hypothetical protein
MLYHYATVAVRYIDGWNLFPSPTKCWFRVLKIKKEPNLIDSSFLRSITGITKKEKCIN